MTELVICLLALALGPVLYQISTGKQQTYSFFDGFVLVAVGGLVLLELLPRSAGALGAPALVVALLGFCLPHLVEDTLHTLPVSPRTLLSSLIVLGLVLHQLLDGAALQPADSHDGFHSVSSLGAAVILHQIPKGFLLWELARKARGLAAAAIVILGLLAATCTGFFLGNEVLRLLARDYVLYFQTFVAGGLLHVVVHHVSACGGAVERRRLNFWGGAGALAALLAFALFPEGHSHPEPGHIAESGFFEPMSHGTMDFRATFVRLSLESAPPILAGLLVAGLIQALIPAGPLLWFRGKNRFVEALRGILLGLPLPVCSCGVMPIYHTLIRKGVPPGAAVAFLIATPELGVDSFFLSFRLLGIEITLVRLAMAFCVAFLASTLLAGVYRKVLPASDAPVDSLDDKLGRAVGVGQKIKGSFKYGFVDLIDDIGVWLVAGIALAALADPYLEPAWFSGLPRGADVVLMALVGLPIYVCASGATPLAAVLLSKGVSVGAVLALLITGPTANITTLGILSRLHGPRRAAALPVTVLLLSVALGLAANAVVSSEPSRILDEIRAHEHGPFEQVCGLLLAVLVGLSVLRLGPRGFLRRLKGGDGSARPDKDHSHCHCP